MGNTYEVKEWVNCGLRWDYTERYRGESLLKALWVAWRLKRQGAGCVKLECR